MASDSEITGAHDGEKILERLVSAVTTKANRIKLDMQKAADAGKARQVSGQPMTGEEWRDFHIAYIAARDFMRFAESFLGAELYRKTFNGES